MQSDAPPSIHVGITVLPNGEGLPLPTYMTVGAAGADVFAAVSEPIALEPFERALIPAGFSVAIPTGYELQVRPRSGFALRSGVTILNAPGTIDADYRGPIGVLLVNLGQERVVIVRGDRIAQLVLAPVARAFFEVTHIADSTARGKGGFGSTGFGGDGP